MSKSNTIRNIPAFVKSYLGSNDGKAALTRQSINVKDKETGKWKSIWRSNQMATAFQQAI